LTGRSSNYSLKWTTDDTALERFEDLTIVIIKHKGERQRHLGELVG